MVGLVLLGVALAPGVTADQGGSWADQDGRIIAIASDENTDRKGDGREDSLARERARLARMAYQMHLNQLKAEHDARVRVFPECNPTIQQPEDWCAWAPPEATEGDSTTPRQLAERIAREVTASLQLPQAYPQIGPDPAWNEWDMAVVGLPLWLWVDGPRQLQTSNSEYGLAVTLDARHVRTTFTMGDSRTVTCATTKPYVRGSVTPGDPSPVCGHTYQVAPKSPSPLSAATQEPGSYQVTATTHWSVDWTAGGHSGTLTTDMSGSRDLPVGELQAVVVHR